MNEYSTVGRLSFTDYIWLSLYLTLLVVIASFHELSHDESQAWNIARASSAIWDVVYHSQYEGHSAMWFGLLWPISLSGNPFLLQIFTIALSLIVAFLLLRDKPFGRYTCVLILFGYYSVFEYSIIVRPYILALLFSALLASSLYQGQKSVGWQFVLCGLIAGTSAFGAVLSVPMALLVFLNHVKQSEKSLILTPATLLSMGVFFVLVLTTCYLVIFPLNYSEFEQAILRGHGASMGNLLTVLSTPFFPHLDRLPLGIGTWLENTVAGETLLIIVMFIVIALVTIYFSSNKTALIAWFVALLTLPAGILYSGSLSERHLGHIYIAVLTIAWSKSGMSESCLKGGWCCLRLKLIPVFKVFFPLILFTVLFYQIAIAVAVGAYEIKKPMSPWKELSLLLIEKKVPLDKLIVDNAYNVGALVAYIDHPVYDIGCQCWTRYFRWSEHNLDVSMEESLTNVCWSNPDWSNVIAVRSNNRLGDEYDPFLIVESKPGVRSHIKRTITVYDIPCAEQRLNGFTM